MRGTLVATLVLAAVASGCGGKGKQEAAATPVATEAQVAKSAFATSANCRQLLGLQAEVAQAMDPSSTPAEVAKPRQALTRLAATAPPEVRSDLRLVADAYGKITRAVKAAYTSSSEAPSPQALARLDKVIAEVDQTALTRANANIGSWVRTNC